MEVLHGIGEDDRTVFVDKGDICYYCENQYGCPLIECLNNGLVTATEPIEVLDCAHFKIFNNIK